MRRITAVICAHHRLKGGAAQLGATGPGLAGPFGTWPADAGRDEGGQEHEHLAGGDEASVSLERAAGG
ncbi:hypothetical protein ACTU45_14145 [Streptomyces sp. 24-1644]|uniref:hypothetical protein n=1 Tax=Streptomyces sp. 24-1644 TaxID=3457315 RepID=UPI003FA7A26E